MTTSRPAIRVLPGVPGMQGLTVDGRTPYPQSTYDFVKGVRLAGYEIEFAQPKEDRTVVGFKAYEDWLPILELSKDLLVGVQGGLLVELLMSYVGHGQTDDSSGAVTNDEAPEHLGAEEVAPSALLHVDWRVTDGDRESRFEADGDAGSVIDALEKFEQSIRDQ